jgi:hypothetical protein|tara:strand:+ start:776 stop:1009 length:234 start_codon:yes stop_codon:yes gene_type:complete
MSAAAKKRWYNKVRRRCLFYGLDLRYLGMPKNYRAVEIVHPSGYVLYADRATDERPLDINWRRIYEEMIKDYPQAIK